MPSTGLPARSAWCVLGLPPLQTTRLASADTSFPGRKRAVTSRGEAGRSTPLVATATRHPVDNAPSTRSLNTLGSPELPMAM
ncbi:MAG: hypothetical protein AW12_02927 [Candidatus Accumulibacter sp. BA-94]|nr:MAG: hypothetical protein AW12_02927 [Candidatus Accumulibacter sp. BA-94]